MGEPVDFDLLLEETLEEFTKPDEVKKKGRSNNKNNINNDTEQDGEGAGMPFDLMEEMQKMLDELNLTSTPAAANLATTPADYKQQKDVYSMKEEDDGSVNELLEQMASLAGSSQTNEDGDPYANASKPKDFNEALNDTVNRIKNSDEKVKSQLSKNESMVDDQMLEQMMKQLGQLDGNGGGSFEGMMKEMVKQLLGKDVLYEPLLELASKYPKWLEDNKGKVSKEELGKYRMQLQYCHEIIKVYDTTPDEFDKISDLMNKMQECGSPPEEILKDLAPGLEFNKDGTPALDNIGNCPTQ